MNGILSSLTGKEKPDNFIYPFFWPDENRPDLIPSEVQAVYNSGCRGLCLEARPFEDFAGESWWNTAKILLEECKKRDMKVWILDDKHFPTGYANGKIRKEHPELCRHWIYETHLDMIGPKKDISVLLPWLNEDENFIFAGLYARDEYEETVTGKCIPLEIRKGDIFAEFDLPEGCWRLFFVIETTQQNREQAWYIDMLSERSVAVLIDEVYENHYRHFSEYFGNTLEGFFSDEPCFRAVHTERWEKDPGFYFDTVGKPGNRLPWNASILSAIGEEQMKTLKEYDISDFTQCLPILWYPHDGLEQTVRFAYMDAVTCLWRKNFSFGLGNWCRDHGLIYTGHVIEDNNAHSRLSSSTGHYFRGLEGQDISGIDIVLHQVLPGMSDHIHAASIAHGHSDGRFFHYTLAHLASSLARITPRMKGRAMCELFGAYGWAEDITVMKWISDFLMIRGVNRFVPHAFSVKHPFDDCPPHFFARGENPQYKGFTRLMEYINEVSTLLDGAVRTAPGAILYYAENEWVSGDDFMYGDVPAKELYDNHIDYDILPFDALKNAEIENGKLIVNGIPHSFLLIPYAAHYAPGLTELIDSFIEQGLPVFNITENAKAGIGSTIDAGHIKDVILHSGLAFDYGLSRNKLRIADYESEKYRFFYIFNEEPARDFEGEIKLPVSGDYTEMRILNDAYYKEHTPDGKIIIRVHCGVSVILVFPKDAEAPGERKIPMNTVIRPDMLWDIDIRESGIDADFREYAKNSELINVTANDRLPCFSGEIRYRSHFVFNGDRLSADLGAVGSWAQLSVNGTKFPVRIAPPYRWDVSSALKKGDNTIEIISGNTLVNRLQDDLSVFMTIRPSGVTGPVSFITV